VAQRTLPSETDVEALLASVPEERRREDARAVCRIMAEETGETPAMWAASMVGLGTRRSR
jgi:hypothetical protein